MARERSQSNALIEVREGEHVDLSDRVLEVPPGVVGVLVRGTLVGNRLVLRGGAPSVRVEQGGLAILDTVSLEGASHGVEIRGGRLEARELSVRDVEGSGLFLASGALEGEEIVIDGARYGLLARPAGTARIKGLTVKGARVTGVAVVGADVEIDGLNISGQSQHGALMANDLTTPLRLSRASFTEVGPVGITLVRAPALIEDLEVSGVSSTARGDEGIGVLAVRSEVSLVGLAVRNTFGEGLAAIGGSVAVTSGLVSGAGRAGVAGWDGADIVLTDVVVRDGRETGLLALEGSRIAVRGGALLGNLTEPALVDCSSGSRVTLEDTVVDEAWTLPRCEGQSR